MPRYFFHLHNDLDVLDHEGYELASPEAAQLQAEREARVMASESVLTKGRLMLSHSIEVTDEAGEPVTVVRFGDVITVES
jgi:PHD/YefM family antitoxin component YafN of YafNO toxin-antitoxin module